MKQSLSFPLIAILLLTLFSCDKEIEIYHLSSSDKELLGYKVGDTFSLQGFDSVHYKTDTLNLSVWHIDFHTEGGSGCIGQKKYSYEIGEMSFEDRNYFGAYGTLEIRALSDKDAFYSFLFRNGEEEYQIHTNNYEVLDTFEINGHSYNDVYVFSNEDSKLYYSKTKGIIKVGDYLRVEN